MTGTWCPLSLCKIVSIRGWWSSLPVSPPCFAVVWNIYSCLNVQYIKKDTPTQIHVQWVPLNPDFRVQKVPLWNCLKTAVWRNICHDKEAGLRQESLSQNLHIGFLCGFFKAYWGTFMSTLSPREWARVLLSLSMYVPCRILWLFSSVAFFFIKSPWSE